MPARIRRLFFYVDGLRYSFEMATLALTRLRETLDKIESKHDNRESLKAEEVSAFLDARVVVDMCHRVRELVQQIPGLSQKEPQIQIFLRGTVEIENLRHHVQHFRSGIYEIPEETLPLWGSLSWTPTNNVSASAQKCCLLVSGNFTGGINAPTCSIDTHAAQGVPKIVLFAGNASSNLLRVGEELKKMKSLIKEWLGKHPNVRLVGGQPFALALYFHKPPQMDASETP